MPFTEHCTVTATLQNFSLRYGNRLASTKYECDNNYFNFYYIATFYPDGNCEDNEGYVSIILKRSVSYYFSGNYPDKFSCTASVVDASGSKRFSQSFVFDQSQNTDESLFDQDFGFERYLRRSTLLSDSPDLLPDDSLNLCLEFDIEYSGLMKLNSRGFNLKNGKCHLEVDSEFARDLCKVSEVFQRMMESPMVERLNRRISLPFEEYKSLMIIFNFFSDHDLCASLSDVYNLYVFADKYDMQVIVQLCHELLTAVGRSARNSQEILDCVEEHMPMISGLAERFKHDERLTEILKNYPHKNELEGELGTSTNVVNQKWSCGMINKEQNVYVIFMFRNTNNLEMDFYK